MIWFRQIVKASLERLSMYHTRIGKATLFADLLVRIVEQQ